MKVRLEHILQVAQRGRPLQTVAASPHLLEDAALRQALTDRLRVAEGATLFLGFDLPDGAQGVAVSRPDRAGGEALFAHGWALCGDDARAIAGNRALLAIGVACIPKLWKQDAPGVSKVAPVAAHIPGDLARRILRAEVLDRGAEATAVMVAALAEHLAVDDDSTLVFQLPAPPLESTKHLAMRVPGLEPKTHDHWRLCRLAALFSALPPSLRARASFSVNDLEAPEDGGRVVLLREPGPAPSTDALLEWSSHVVALADQDDPGPLDEFHRRGDVLATPRSAADLDAVRGAMAGRRRGTRQTARIDPGVELARVVGPADLKLLQRLTAHFSEGSAAAERGWIDLSDEWGAVLWKRSAEQGRLPAVPTVQGLGFSLMAYATVRAEVDGATREAFSDEVFDLLARVRPEGVGAGAWQRAATAFRDRLWFLVDTAPVPADVLGAVVSELTEELRGALGPGQALRTEEIAPFLVEHGGLENPDRSNALAVLVRQLHGRGASLLSLLWSEHGLAHEPVAYPELLERVAGTSRSPLPGVLSELAERSHRHGPVPRFVDFARGDGHGSFVERLGSFLHRLAPERNLFAHAAYMAADPATRRALRPGLVAFLEEEAPALADLDFSQTRGEPPLAALEAALRHAMAEDDSLAQRAAMAVDEIAATLGGSRGAALIRALHESGLKDAGVAAWTVLHAHWRDR